MANPSNSPGMYPAINKAATEAVPPLAKAYMIRMLLGGINKPVVEDVMFTEALNVLGYPSSSILSVMIEPIAEAAARAEPEIAPKSIEAKTFT